PFEESLLGHRLRDEESLRKVAAETREELQLLLSLDALGYHLEVHCFSERDNSLDDALVVRRLRKSLDERPVDLEGLRRQLGQVAQRGITGAEIVDVDADAQRRQVGEQGTCDGEIFE